MNCLSCYKKHLSIAYIHCNSYLEQRNDYDLLKIFSEVANALQHGRKMSKKQFDDSMEIYNEIINNDFNITKDISDKIYMAYYK